MEEVQRQFRAHWENAGKPEFKKAWLPFYCAQEDLFMLLEMLGDDIAFIVSDGDPLQRTKLAIPTENRSAASENVSPSRSLIART